MMSAALAVQKAIRNRLIADTVLPASKIMDRHERPVPTPSIIIGEAQTLDEGDIARNQVRVLHDLHVWKKEPALTGANKFAGYIRKSIHRARLDLGEGFHCVDAYISNTRLMRDPDGETSHAVVTVSTLVSEVSS